MAKKIKKEKQKDTLDESLQASEQSMSPETNYQKIPVPPEVLQILVQKNNQKDRLKNAIIVIIILSFFSSILISQLDFKMGNVAIVKIYDTISYDNQNFELESVLSFLDSLKYNKRIKAIVLDINSPGGSAVATHHLVKKIQQLKNERNLTVYALIREYGTSGAYWIASVADRIYADELSLVGSIGVLSSFVTIQKFLERYNITYERIVGGKYKDLGSIFKDLNEEERQLLLSKITMVHDFFISSVAQKRNIPEEKMIELATGEFFIGLEGKELGLIDEFGTLDDLIKRIEIEKNITVIPLVYKAKKSIWQRMLGFFEQAGFSFGKGFIRGITFKTDEKSTVQLI
ncbi:MAG: signal peptide peptidase SppA [Candidatus Woesearchaeota archaeon]